MTEPGFVSPPYYLKSFLVSKGIAIAGYNALMGRHVLGGLLSYEPQQMIHKSAYYVSTETNDTELYVVNYWGESIINNYSIAIRYDYNWLVKKKLKLYSGLSTGILFRQSKTTYYQVYRFQNDFPDEVLEDYLRYRETDVTYNLHINVIGLSYGSTWAITAEIGMGHRGYINIGISRLLSRSPNDCPRIAR